MYEAQGLRNDESTIARMTTRAGGCLHHPPDAARPAPTIYGLDRLIRLMVGATLAVALVFSPRL
jgi:hypothetical protein